MVDATGLRTRAATLADAAAIAAIYNEGIADRIATFETEQRSAGQIAEWFSGRNLARAGGLNIRPIRAIRWASHSRIKPAQGGSDGDRMAHLTAMPQCCITPAFRH